MTVSAMQQHNASWETSSTSLHGSFDSDLQHHHHQQQQQHSGSAAASAGGGGGGGAAASAGGGGNRPASSGFPPDRRKQFDTTTPTLIDEEDYCEEGEMLSLEQQARLKSFERQQQQQFGSVSVAAMSSSVSGEDSEIRRTPGASAMHKSSFNTMDDIGNPATAGGANIGGGGSGRDEAAGSLGYALTLSTPIAATKKSASMTSSTLSGEDQHKHQQQQQQSKGVSTRTTTGHSIEEESIKPGSWESSYKAAEETGAGDTSQTRPPLPPPLTASASEGALPFPPSWTEDQQQHQQQIQRQGAFSPGLLRLTEDIGNLLQEDEDDDYTIEIPSVFRSEGEEPSAEPQSTSEATGTTISSSAAAADWTGSFVLEKNKTFAKRTVGRAAVPQGRTRRSRGGGGGGSGVSSQQFQQQAPPTHQHNIQQQQRQQQQSAPFSFPQAQQPKPRRSGNEVFEFGKSQSDDTSRRVSPQLLNFGGAFAPLAKEYGAPAPASSSFSRPVAFAPAPPPMGESSSFSFQQSLQPPQIPASSYRPDYPSDTAPASMPPTQGGSMSQPLFHAHSFDSYQSAGTASNQGRITSPAYLAPYSFASPSPTAMVSDMQATAQEFVPMVTRSTPPMFPQPQSQAPPQWSHQQQHHSRPTSSSSYDLPSSATPTSFATAHGAHPSYHHSAHTTAFGYGYGLQQQPPPQQSSVLGEGHRAAMTPSPHLPVWHQQAPPQSMPPSSQQHLKQPPCDSMSSSSPSPFHGSSGTLMQQHPSSSRVSSSFGAQQSSATTSSTTTTSQAGLAGVSAGDPSQRGSSGSGGALKKDMKRGKRGKKKYLQGSASISVSSSSSAKSEKKAATTSGRSKKKENEQGARPWSSAHHSCSRFGQGEDALVLASDDLVDSRRADLDESPATRLAFKQFYKAYRSKEQFGVQQAEDFAMQALQDGSLPKSVHWRVYIELADLARRTNRFVEARRLYQSVCQLQPYASQGWVEYSKLEEECGNMNRVTNILHEGLEYCEYNENLLIRAVKHQERMGNMTRARALLARLKHVGIDKVWRTILEGAMFEARAGNTIMARRVLKYIMHHVPWYGPLYVEFYRLERDHGHPLDALEIVERGLSQIPRYGPLWFSALRICEELDFADRNFQMPRTSAMLRRASTNVNKEITWKVHLEAAFIFERAAQEQAVIAKKGTPSPFLGPARHFFALTIRSCRLNLRWKVFLAAARMELCSGSTEKARTLFLRAHQVAPEKVRSLTFLDYARMHEFTGDAQLTRAMLCKGRYVYGHDWKVWLESVLLEMREFNLMRAFELASRALDVHHGTGRLWAALVQLSQYSGGDEAQYQALKSALNAVPKSGEVWCEGARIHLNPFSDLFDLDRARRHLFFAGKFTPQYGDSFLEAVRLELLFQWLAPIADYIWEETKSDFAPSKKANGFDCLTKYITDVSLAISVASKADVEPKNVPRLVHKKIVPTIRRRLKKEEYEKCVDLSATVLSCSNVDPNYGPLWFNCRRVQIDPPRRVVEHAAECMAKELQKHAHVYLAAMLRRKAVLSTTSGQERPQQAVDGENDIEVFDPALMEWEDGMDVVLRKFPSLRDIFNPVDPTTGLVLLESTLDGSDFVTGLMEYNRHRPINEMSLADKKRAIFATDALFP